MKCGDGVEGGVVVVPEGAGATTSMEEEWVGTTPKDVDQEVTVWFEMV